jgi:uncharacterized membrane protein YdfJ with MMPL/SSD domain
VLVDTFLVRPVLAPAMMAILGSAAYWPARMPTPTRGPLLPLGDSVHEAKEGDTV